MTHYNYLIIGGGMTADAAVRGIRKVDTDGSIGLIGAESDPPYNRPPLSKGLWQGTSMRFVWRHTEKQDVTLHLGRRATDLDLDARQVNDDQGDYWTFDKLLLATGGTPKRLPGDNSDVVYFRTLADFHKLHDQADGKRRFAVIGGGFIGSEIAAAVASKGQPTTMIFPEDGIGARVFPRDLSLFLNDYYRDKGVDVQAGEFLSGISAGGGAHVLGTESGKRIEADVVVAGLGIEPNVGLAEDAGLEVDNGIVVDEHLRTRHPDVYAAGDVANFQSALLNQRMRVEHEDGANTMGEAAGRAMAGAGEAYEHQPFFYSDLFDLGYEAVGELDSRAEIVTDWKEANRKGVVYYLADGRVRGVLLWDTWGQQDAAKGLMAEPGPFKPEDLRGRI